MSATINTNQSISRSVSWSITQSINQSINQSISQSINHSINHSIKQSSSQTVSQSVIQSLYLSINQSLTQSTNFFILYVDHCYIYTEQKVLFELLPLSGGVVGIIGIDDDIIALDKLVLISLTELLVITDDVITDKVITDDDFEEIIDVPSEAAPVENELTIPGKEVLNTGTELTELLESGNIIGVDDIPVVDVC